MLASFSRLSLLWKILLSTSIALTLLFAVMGWIVQDNATRAMSASLNEEVQASFRAYDSLWRSRADTLAAVSLVISRMSDVRAAFSTGDQATIRDSAGELWKQISNQDAIFLVADPQGKVLASLGGDADNALTQDLPVVRDADRKTFAEIEKNIGELAVKARDGKLEISDLTGGTFTITTGGIYGSLLSTPILNAPQSGILGMHAIQQRPVAKNGEVVIRPMMYVALSYDHRIVDGSEAVRFLVRVKELAEDPTNLLLEG